MIHTQKEQEFVDTCKIAQEMNVSACCIRKLCARYKNVESKDVRYPPYHMGRPSDSMPGRREHSAILTYRQDIYRKATGLENGIGNATGIHIPHNTI